MDAIKILRDDHKVIRGLFRQFEGVILRAPEMKRGVVLECLMQLEVHQAIEQGLFYPAFDSRAQQASDTLTRSLVGKFHEAHAAIQADIAQLRSMPVTAEGFDDEMRVLVANAEDHFSDEEDTMFRLAEDMLGEDLLRQLAESMEAQKHKLMSHPRYRDALPEVAQNPRGGEQKRRVNQRAMPE